MNLARLLVAVVLLGMLGCAKERQIAEHVNNGECCTMFKLYGANLPAARVYEDMCVRWERCPTTGEP